MAQRGKKAAPSGDLDDFKQVNDVLNGAGAEYGGIGDQEPPGDPLEEQFGLPQFKLRGEEAEPEPADGEETRDTPDKFEIPDKEAPHTGKQPAAPQIDKEALKKATEAFLKEEHTPQTVNTDQFANYLQQFQKFMPTGDMPQVDVTQLRQAILDKTGGDGAVADAFVAFLETVAPVIQEQMRYQSVSNAVALMQNMSNLQASTETVRQSFYGNYKDLQGWEDVVGHVAGRVQKQYPNHSFGELFSIVAQQSRDAVKRIREKTLSDSADSGGRKRPVNIGTGRRAATEIENNAAARKGKGQTRSNDVLDDLIDTVHERGFVI